MKPVIAWTIKMALLFGLITGLVYAHGALTRLRQQVAQQEQALENKPDQLFYKAAVEAELTRHDFDIRRIQGYAPRREEIIDVVSDIEEEGQSENVVVVISDIKEELILDRAGKPVAAEGPLQDIAISVVAVGDPVALLNFLYRLDHMPYVLSVKSWHVSPDRAAQQPSSSGESGLTSTPQSRLEVDINMSSMTLEL